MRRKKDKPFLYDPKLSNQERWHLALNNTLLLEARIDNIQVNGDGSIVTLNNITLYNEVAQKFNAIKLYIEQDGSYNYLLEKAPDPAVGNYIRMRLEKRDNNEFENRFLSRYQIVEDSIETLVFSSYNYIM